MSISTSIGQRNQDVRFQVNIWVRVGLNVKGDCAHYFLFDTDGQLVYYCNSLLLQHIADMDYDEYTLTPEL